VNYVDFKTHCATIKIIFKMFETTCQMTVSHPRSLESSATLLWGQIFQLPSSHLCSNSSGVMLSVFAEMWTLCFL